MTHAHLIIKQVFAILLVTVLMTGVRLTLSPCRGERICCALVHCGLVAAFCCSTGMTEWHNAIMMMDLLFQCHPRGPHC